MHTLAIVIPAFKKKFLKEALKSISNQTNKDFTLYVADDCSPENLKQIVDDFVDLIDIVYFRFDTNLGGQDLVAHWKRSIDLTRGEPYIWLFSDDDVMSEDCVDFFLRTCKKKYGLYHFDLVTIDERGEVLKNHKKYPEFISTKSFIDEHLNGNLFNTVVEFIFSRDIYEKNGGFESFDLAWGSDFISWIKFSQQMGGIVTIPRAKVFWRCSSLNITPNKNRSITIRKINAVIDNYIWLKSFFKKHGYRYGVKYDKIVYGEILRAKNSISKKDGLLLAKRFYNCQGGVMLFIMFLIIWNFRK